MSEAAKSYEDLDTIESVEELMSDEGGAAVLDFWSPTCGPCMAMAKDFEAVAGQFEAGEIRFCKINTQNQGHLAAPFNIRAVPTILFVLDGEILDSVVGAMPARRLGERAEWLVRKSERKGKGLLGRLFS